MTTPKMRERQTPRNDELMNRTAGWSDADHLVELDKLSRELEQESGNLYFHLNVILNVLDEWDYDISEVLPAKFKDMRAAARAALGEGA